MVNYFDFDKLIWEIIDGGKERGSLDSLGIRIREFNKDNIKIPALQHLDEKFYLVYIGTQKIDQDELYSAWKNRLAYVPKLYERLDEEQFKENIIIQMQTSALERFEDNFPLSIFALNL